ncbi:predicted protein [Phaeodactylum tricornutum CCAP 1055/1]|uniref:Uncharacterized protein n=3 Tax=Phaeodactylum tricornutum TaxID=2850 RepID=B7G8M3_PHATC|nr:predicted protein [Phaeodactylum tricornutum CCAP 1055/1]EEC45068.1 predicted protein [Phaeodactylum tricornutum CCAP 1055/1]|eukprot:XP_002183368.1 predicted protein [Phaeodactylum tricornutum CCAP 1055/1]
MWMSRTRGVIPRLLAPRRSNLTRNLGAASTSRNTLHEEQNLVRTTICRMLEEAQHHNPEDQLLTGKPSDEALLKAVEYFESQLEEARQCIADCSQQEEGSNQLEEWETADDALERATAALIDLIEELQAADESQHHTHKAMRQSSAATIKALRQELGAIKAKISA